jgi:SAM-dependent methyltransferase
MSMPIIVDDQIRALAPSLFSYDGSEPAVDQDVRQQFFRVYKPLRDQGLEPYHLARVASALYYFRPLLSNLLHPTRALNVLEIGSGFGWKALTWADLFASYTGIELNSDFAVKSANYFEDFGVDNAKVICGNAEAILGQPEVHGIPRIDVLVLYAVLEHLTVPERRSILRFAQDIYLRGGRVLIAESPNRLCRLDIHSWQLPFVEWLPEEILAEYAAKSTREDLTSQLAAAPPERIFETLYRIGRGISFHEFECFWDKATFANLGVLGDGYSVGLLKMSPWLRDEWDLLTFCHDNEIHVPRLFTRYWVEGILSQSAGRKEANDVRYIAPKQIKSAPVRERRRFWELDQVTIYPKRSHRLQITNPSEIKQNAVLLIDIHQSSGTLVVEELDNNRAATIDLGKVARARMPTWHTQVALPIGASKTHRITVCGRDGALTYQGVLYV